MRLFYYNASDSGRILSKLVNGDKENPFERAGSKGASRLSDGQVQHDLR